VTPVGLAALIGLELYTGIGAMMEGNKARQIQRLTEGSFDSTARPFVASLRGPGSVEMSLLAADCKGLTLVLHSASRNLVVVFEVGLSHHLFRNVSGRRRKRERGWIGTSYLDQTAT
jgi:hypothetical protein